MIEYQNARQNPNLGGGQDEPDLPPRNTTRWVARRKAQVVTAVETGALSIGEAMERYRLSLEEFQSWQRALDRSGVAGLRIAAAQRRRKENPPKLVLVKH
ncbi:DUF1153 domain-containing protein [Novosphingobium sp. NPDC080210]|uniref:DUF1153 domain-containing protein n=1 Tax=Novosphingobium sp. NPDC080210 TaxID=3390596 RepID=UPI003CFF3394